MADPKTSVTTHTKNTQLVKCGTRFCLIPLQILRTRWKTVLNNLIVLNKHFGQQTRRTKKEKKISDEMWANDRIIFLFWRESVNELKEEKRKKLKKYYN